MTPEAVHALFRLPDAAVLDRRVAKSDLADQLASAPGKGKPGDRSLVNDRIDALHWYAAINSANTGLLPDGVPGLAVVTLITRGSKPQPPPRLITLIHRTVPDPLILITAYAAPAGDASTFATTLSIKPALGEVLVADLPAHDEAPSSLPAEVPPLLAVERASSLSDLHRRWTQAVLGLAAHRTLGRFPHADTPDENEQSFQQRRATLERIDTLDAEIRKLATAARREKQAGRRAELNERLQRARREREQAAQSL